MIADPHVSPDREGSWKLYHRTESRLRTAIADCETHRVSGSRATPGDINRLAVDAAVFLGDLTRDGEPQEFDRVDELLARCAVPVLCVPGNHDVPKTDDEHSSPPLLEFVSRYTPGSLPFTERVGGVDIVGLNTASMPDDSLSVTHRGAVSSAQLDWLERTLPETENPIVVMHHPVGRERDHGHRVRPGQYRLANANELSAVLSSHGVQLCLSGHVHWPSIAPLETGYEVGAPAVCSFPQAYLLVHIEPRGTTVELVPLTDREGLSEAYHAAREHPRSARFIAAADGGYFQRFPLVDSAPDQWVRL